MRIQKQMCCNIYVGTLFFGFKNLNILPRGLAKLIANRHPHRVAKKVAEMNFDFQICRERTKINFLSDSLIGIVGARDDTSGEILNLFNRRIF